MLNDDEHDEGMDHVGSMDASAIGQHEMYRSWVSAGFTPDQAMDLLKVILTETMRGSD